jgi:hypothetical protein
MAAPRRVQTFLPIHTEETRARIKAHKLLERVQNFALGNDPEAMSANQLRAALSLLDKVVPSLQTVEVKSEETRTYVLRAPSPAKDAQEWLTKFGPKTIEHVPDKPNGKVNGKAN